LYGIESRANAVLSNLALHDEDDVSKQLHYARAAANAAQKAGDAFALQTALLQMLSGYMRQGDVEKSASVDKHLATIHTDDLAEKYLTIFKSIRLAWSGQFAEAHRLLRTCWERMGFDFDRMACGGQYALFLAIDGQRQESLHVAEAVLRSSEGSHAPGLFRIRSFALAKVMCALSEGINGRSVVAERVLRSVEPKADPVVKVSIATVRAMMTRFRHPGAGDASASSEGTRSLASLGYADIAKLLEAVERVLSRPEIFASTACDLTAAERQILKLLSEGFIPKDIALRTDRSVYTVRVHIANAIAKLGCHGRSEAIKAAQHLQLI
ncbi:MAG: response regulator transcription factor, partial [Acetobacteraceae bacterium]|nr:response regulator transcription factor [Acetobacteraceae bacterium]